MAQLQSTGFVGVGRMGARMARRLMAAGYPLTVYDTSKAAVQPLVEGGAKRAESPAAVASAADICVGQRADAADC